VDIYRRYFRASILAPTILALALVWNVQTLNGANASTSRIASEFSQPLDDVTEELSAERISEHFGVSIEQARLQMSRQKATFALSARVDAQTKKSWAGSKIDQKNGGKLIIWTTDPTAVNAALASEPSDNQASVDVRPVPHSYDELDETSNDLQAALAAAGIGSDLAYPAVDPSANDVLLKLPTAEQLYATNWDAAQLYSLAHSVAQKFPDVRVSTSGIPNVPAACNTTYELCDPSLRGGIEIQSNAGTLCTGGFVVWSVYDYIPYLLTAGHCVGNNVPGPRWFTGFANGERHYIGDAWNSLPPTGNFLTDEAILRIENPAG
jgi:hypothetical protein